MRYSSDLNATLAMLVALASFGAGCDGCPGSKPYTPYTLTDAPAAATGGGEPGASTGGGGPEPTGSGGGDAAAKAVPAFTQVPAEPAPGDGKTWTVAPDIDAKAPAGRVFVLGLLLDADGDGKRDLIAWAQAPDGLRGELRFVPAGKPGDERTIAALPGDLSTQGCSAKTALAQVGPRSIAFDFVPQCASSRKATRWTAVVRFGRGEEGATKGPELGLEIRAIAPPPGELIDISVDGSDRDGDGRDDIAAKITLSGGLKPFSGAVGPYPSLPPASAIVAFFDRPTGLSRDPSEPGASLDAAAVALLGDAKKKDTAVRVAPAVHELRRLRAVLCDEGGKVLVTTSAGPIECGDGRDVEDVAISEAWAAATKGDPAKALAAIGRIDARAPLSDARKREILKILGKAAPIASYQQAYRAAAAPKVETTGWSPLAFEPSGDLLIKTAEGVTRVDRATFAEVTLSAGAPAGGSSAAPAPAAGGSSAPSAPQAGSSAWPSAIVSEGSGAAGDAWVLAGVEQRCDAPTLAALVEDVGAKGDPSERRTSIVLPIITGVNARGTPSSGRCSAIGSVSITPVASTADFGLVFSVGTELVGLKRQNGAAVVSLVAKPLDAATGGPFIKGAARSPDGSTIALPTTRGLLVMTAGGATKLWSGGEIEQASRCVPASGGARVACVSGGAAVIYDAR